MKKRSWKEVLENAQKETLAYQQEHIKEICDAFKEFWDTNPSENDCAKYMARVIISPRMIYYMVTHKIKNKVNYPKLNME